MVSLDASILVPESVGALSREEVRRKHISFAFPEGFNAVDIFDECRMLTSLGTVTQTLRYTAQALEGKRFIICLKNHDGGTEKLCDASFPRKMRDLEAIPAFKQYPVLIVWLSEQVITLFLERVSISWKTSAAAAGSKEALKDDPFNTGEASGTADSGIVKAYFGDELLFACYEFLHEMHVKPKSFLELFEFFKYQKVKNTMNEIAIAMAKAGANG